MQNIVKIDQIHDFIFLSKILWSKILFKKVVSYSLTKFFVHIGGRWALSFADAVKSPYNQTDSKQQMEVNETNSSEE